MSMDVLTRNNVKCELNGKQPMLFSHGFGCDQNMWRLLTPAFRDHYDLVLFDHVGAGKSDLGAYHCSKYSSLQGYADDILEICDELALRDVVFVGHSVSAMIGILAANKEPQRFARLILVAPSPCYLNDGDYIGGFDRASLEELMEALDSNYLGWSQSLAPVIMANAERPELGEELTNSFCRTDPEIARHFARVTFFSDNRQDLPNCKTPSLILQCSHDIIAPTAVGDYLHAKLPESQLVLLQASGHCPNLSAPAETIAAIKNFL